MYQYLIVNTSFMVQSDEDKAVDLDNPDKYFSAKMAFSLVSTIHSGHFNILFRFSSVLVTHPNFLLLSVRNFFFFSQVGYEFLLHRSGFFVLFCFYTYIYKCMCMNMNMYMYVCMCIHKCFVHRQEYACAHTYVLIFLVFGSSSHII